MTRMRLSPARTRLGRSATRSFVAALLPPEFGGPDPDRLVSRLDGYMQHTPRTVSAGFTAACIALDLLARTRKGARLADLPPEVREDFLVGVARSGAGAVLDGLKALVLLAHGSEAYSGVILQRARRMPPARPDPELDVVPSTWWPSSSYADAVVVGSGAGGAIVARTLARRGMDVVVLEEGRWWRVSDFRSGDPLARYAGMYRDGGTTVALGRPPVVLPIGRGVGGTTLVNSGTCFRPPRHVLESWRDRFGLSLADPDRLLPHLEEVEKLLEVGPVPLEVMGRNGLTTLRGAEALGWSSGPLVRNAPGCAGSCQCAIGCPRNAKSGTHLSVLPDACAAGARIVTEARVYRVVCEDGRARGVEARRPDGSRFRIDAPVVVVSAGATETPTLLRRSGLGGHPHVGRNLSVHPAVAVAGRFDEPVVPWEGVLQSAMVDEFHDEKILMEATSTPPGMGSIVLPGFGRRLLEELGRADRLATLGAMIGDRPSGSVTGTRRAVVRYQLHPEDARLLMSAISKMARVLFAAGAREVLCGIPGSGPATSPEEVDEAVARARPHQLHVAAFHPTGTCRAGDRPDLCPVDECGALRGARGVWVADASVLPTCPEVNPQVSIMAVASAIAEEIAVAAQ
ncbi:MAG: putative GMC-type oxidoreductase [Acidimicrobiales bacterium]|nr:MAG: putative GMC-type oxidoreductase [Acidimicrobiales bacterium]